MWTHKKVFVPIRANKKIYTDLYITEYLVLNEVFFLYVKMLTHWDVTHLNELTF